VLKTVTEPPYTVSIDADDLSGGDHTLSAGALTASGAEASVEETFQASAGSGSGNSMFIMIGAAVAAGLVILLVVWLVLRQRGGDEPEPTPSILKPDEPPENGVGTAAPAGSLRRLLEDRPLGSAELDIGQPLGHLVVLGGPLAGQSFLVGDAAASIGAGHRCLIQIGGNREDGEEIGPEEARVWVRGGQLMVHLLRRLTAMGATSGGWAILGTGESFSIGDHTFRFELDSAAAAAMPAAPGAAPLQATPSSPMGETQPLSGLATNGGVHQVNVGDATAASGDAEVPNIWKDKPNEAQEHGAPSEGPAPAAQPQQADQPAPPQAPTIPGMPTASPNPPIEERPHIWPRPEESAEEASG
jgi:hypothetical protein